MIRDETAFQAQAALDQLAATAHATALSATAAPSTPTTPSTPTATTSTAPGTAATATATATAVAPLDPAEVLKKDLINQRVRNDNRERKKRWREANEDRSKCFLLLTVPFDTIHTLLLSSAYTYIRDKGTTATPKQQQHLQSLIVTSTPLPLHLLSYPPSHFLLCRSSSPFLLVVYRVDS